MKIVIDPHKTLDIVIAETIMIGTGMKETMTITTIVMIGITPPVITDEERSNRETMRTSAVKVTRTTDVLTRNGTLSKRIVRCRQRNTNKSRIEA